MNSRLLNIPVIMLAVLTISVGTYIYNSSQSTITDAMQTLSTQEVDAFNSLFVMYEGEQTGSSIKALMGRLIGNADTYRDESVKVPQVYIDKPNETARNSIEATFTEYDDGDVTNYIKVLSEIRNSIESIHTYYVTISYQDNGLIDYIHITYNEDSELEVLSRDS